MYLDILATVRELLSFRERLSAARNQDRVALAGYLDAIADVIGGIVEISRASDARVRERFASLCVQLKHHAQNCAAIIEAVLGPEAATGLARSINVAVAERDRNRDGDFGQDYLYDDQLSALAQRESRMKLEEAMGLLRATAVTLRGPAPKGPTPLARVQQLIRGR